MNRTYDDVKKSWIIDIDIDMDLYNVPKLKEMSESCINEKQADILLDCSKMQYMDSTGLGVLVSILKRVREYQGKIHVSGLKPHVMRIFTITGLDKEFCFEEELDG